MTGTPPLRSISKVLVANRGEIARRILRTLRALGLQSVAVYSDADADAPYVKEADEAVRLGPAPSAESYLHVERILAAARAVGADAVHPGYGFLSERAELAARVSDAGLVFIGPSADAIAKMGSKIESKRIAAQAGVPVIPGFTAAGLSAAELEQRAEQLGYPVLIKASAGGGGRGMRVVTAKAELAGALESAAREAAAAFGDGALLVEKYLEAPRHIEVQVFGDVHGNVVHLFERECSIQRRHQKVIEEAPSPALSAELRAKMGAAAVSLARAIGYTGAGTVELVLDRGGSFFFLEMNTRLQVEHPVTEAITGLDLVRMQLEVAEGRALSVTQETLAISGHAIEARLYAEDAAREFLPATGRVALFQVPSLPGLRVDSGVEAGSEVSVHYDALLAKVIAHGATREEARRKLVHGLRQLAVGGVVCNREFLVQVLEHPKFAAGETDTGFIERHLPAERRGARRRVEEVAAHAVAAALWMHAGRRRAAGEDGGAVPASVPSGFRNNRWRGQEQVFEVGGERVVVGYVAREGGRFEVGVGQGQGQGQGHVQSLARVIVATEAEITAEIGGVRRRFVIAQAGERVIVHTGEITVELDVVPRFPARVAAQVAGGCVAPMTGVVRKVAVAQGQRVGAGDLLLVLEAMKMEHRLVAQAAGIVKAVRVREGQMVDPDDVLVIVEADPNG